MTYEYEFKVDGKLVRRKYSQFNNQIIKVMAEDITKLHVSQQTFELCVRKMEWKDRKPEVC